MTEGTSEETFSPHEKVTREQAATFLYRYATNVLGFWFTLEGDLSGVLAPLFRARKADPAANVAVDVDPDDLL